jgi:hypothetical protein
LWTLARDRGTGARASPVRWTHALLVLASGARQMAPGRYQVDGETVHNTFSDRRFTPWC